MSSSSRRFSSTLSLGLRLGLLAAALVLGACEKQREIYVLTSSGRILGFDSDQPDSIKTKVSVSGLPTNESLVQLDYRPASDSFYCLTSEERLCTVDPRTGSVSLVRATEFTTDDLAGAVIDFNPVDDRLRLIAREQNLRLNPNDGTVAGTDTVADFDNDDENDDRDVQLVAIAYDNNRAGADAATLYGLELITQSLVRIGSKGGSPTSPNTGRLFTVASLGAAFTANSGFDIEPGGDKAWAALSGGGSGAVLYRIDLSDGSTDRVDEIDNGDTTVIDLAVGPEKKSGGSPS